MKVEERVKREFPRLGRIALEDTHPENQMKWKRGNELLHCSPSEQCGARNLNLFLFFSQTQLLCFYFQAAFIFIFFFEIHFWRAKYFLCFSLHLSWYCQMIERTFAHYFFSISTKWRLVMKMDCVCTKKNEWLKFLLTGRKNWKYTGKDCEKRESPLLFIVFLSSLTHAQNGGNQDGKKVGGVILHSGIVFRVWWHFGVLEWIEWGASTKSSYIGKDMWQTKSFIYSTYFFCQIL